MTFAVTLKGLRRYCGKLDLAYRFIEQEWGSLDSAWGLGVKLEPVTGR